MAESELSEAEPSNKSLVLVVQSGPTGKKAMHTHNESSLDLSLRVRTQLILDLHLRSHMGLSTYGWAESPECGVSGGYELPPEAGYIRAMWQEMPSVTERIQSS